MRWFHKKDKKKVTLDLEAKISKDARTEDIYKERLKFLDERTPPTNNQARFPDNVFKPDVAIVGDKYYDVYKFQFNGLNDLYNYLKANPDINEGAYGKSLSSIEGSYDFAGVKYPTAVERLVNYNDPKYDEFLTISTKTKVKNLKLGAMFEPTNSVAGGIIRPHALAVGDPHIYRTTKIYKVDKTVSIHAMASYLAYTTKKQVYNKAVILTNIIHALEEQGIKVNMDVFTASVNYDEIIEVDLLIKKNGKNTNYQALYRSLCNVEFLRRIIFRVKETSDVQTWWASGYGSTCDEEFIRKYKNFSEDDYYFGQPREMGIYGKDIGEDFENAVNHLNLQNVIDVEKAKVRIKQSIKK